MRLPPPGPRRDLTIALLLAVAAAVFRLPRLGYPTAEYFDEVYHAKTAQQYLDGETPTEWVHPPTAKLLIAGAVAAFGYEPWAWRLAPALAGILVAPVFFLLARRTLRGERAALLASILVLADGVYLVQSRIAMTNIFAVLFQLSAVLFVLTAALADRQRVGAMLAGGVCLGLAVSTRWTSLWAWGFLGLVYAAVRLRRGLRSGDMLLAALTFAVLPLVLYVLSYAAVPVLSPWGERTLTGDDLAMVQVRVWDYHANLSATHPYFSEWFTWPWLTRPTWYFFEVHDNSIYGIVALGNPGLWWLSVPVTVWALLTGLVQRDPRRLFAASGFCLLYLPWGLSPRTLNYSHYLFEAIPYACLSLGMLLDRAWDGPLGQVARGYVIFVVLLFLFFVPLLTALPIPRGLFYYDLPGDVTPWTWFRSWI